MLPYWFPEGTNHGIPSKDKKGDHGYNNYWALHVSLPWSPFGRQLYTMIGQSHSDVQFIALWTWLFVHHLF